ncbi:MAG TPA: rhodanese-like domain-containing protein, partial [Bryobacteraceae bacterium]|nr:rhodanese-like domain-containing protein [Bryobacteraceae bacterium]
PTEVSPQEVKRMLDAGEPVHLVDVREPHEHQTARIESAELIPMRAVPHQLAALQQKAATAPLVIFCHHGVRSLQTVSWLRRQGVERCHSMSGGIDAWSASIDPEVPRY